MKLRSKLTFIAFLCLFAPCQSKEQALLLLNVEACAVDESIAKILISVGRYETRVPGGKLRKADLALQDLHILHISLHELRSREKAAIHFSQLILPIDCNEISLATPFNNKLREGAFFLDFPFGYAISSGRYNAWELENSPTKWRILGGFPSVFLPTYETFQRYGDVLLSSRYPTDIRDRALKITDTAALRRVSRAIVEAPSKPRLRILTAGNWALVIAEHPTTCFSTKFQFYRSRWLLPKGA